jgi:hypothetical protein
MFPNREPLLKLGRCQALVCFTAFNKHLSYVLPGVPLQSEFMKLLLFSSVYVLCAAVSSVYSQLQLSALSSF